MSIVPENFSDECLGKFLPAKPPASLVPENFSPADQDKFFPIRPVLLPTSPSPAASIKISANEALSDPMTFSEAMKVVLRGGMIRRLGWPYPTIIVKLINEKVSIVLADDLYHPLIISTGDLQARDWVRVPEE